MLDKVADSILPVMTDKTGNNSDVLRYKLLLGVVGNVASKSNNSAKKMSNFTEKLIAETQVIPTL